MSNSRPATQQIDISPLVKAQATLLMPLWARACENRRSAPLLRDPLAEKIVDRLNFDFGHFERQRVSSLDYCIRASVIDQMIADFLRTYDEATVVEIGVGLDSRYDRLNNGRVTWIELDLPDVIQIRKQLFEATCRRIMIGDSMLKSDWLDCVSQHRRGPLLFVSEGVFYFFKPDTIRTLLIGLADRFPESGIIFDAQSPLFLQLSRWRHPMRDSQLLFSLGNPRQVEDWDLRFRLERYIGFGDSPYYDASMRRVSRLRRWGRKLFPLVRNFFKIVQVGW